MSIIEKIIYNYKSNNKTLVFKIPFLNKENILEFAVTYSYLSLNEKEVIKLMTDIEQNNINFKSWVFFNDIKKFPSKNS